MRDHWLIWQLADSAFPSGGFAHSGGLEAAWHHGMVPDAAALEQLIGANLAQTRRGALCFTAEAWNSPDAMPAIDRRCDLFINNHVANRASRAQGRAMLSSAAKAFGDRTLMDLAATVREKQLPSHLAVVFGCITSAMGIAQQEACAMLLFMTARGYLSAAVRLGIIGPMEAQQMQARLGEQCRAPIEPGTPVQTAPLLDLVQGTQDRLYSRLFQS